MQKYEKGTNCPILLALFSLYRLMCLIYPFIVTIIVTLLGVMEEYIYGFHSDEEIYCYWTTIPNIHFCFTGILWYLSDT